MTDRILIYSAEDIYFIGNSIDTIHDLLEDVKTNTPIENTRIDDNLEVIKAIINILTTKYVEGRKTPKTPN